MIAALDTTAVAPLARAEAASPQPGRAVAPEQPARAEKAARPDESGAGAAAGTPAARLSPEAQAELRKLQETDRKVRQHEQAHRAAGGNLTGAASYQYTRGPDGKMYATAGEVQVRIPQGGEPEERIRQLEQVIRAALAPADPSPQDRAVAARARALIAEARAELQEKKAEEQRGEASDPLDPPADQNQEQDQGGGANPFGMGIAAYERAGGLSAKASRIAFSA